MKRYLCTLLLFVSSLSFALTPVTINSASINYTTHTVTVAGSGFCTGAVPAVIFNTTRLKVTSACSSSVVVASLPVQAAGSYRLIITNTSGGSFTFYVTYGAVGPQGPQGFTERQEPPANRKSRCRAQWSTGSDWTDGSDRSNRGNWITGANRVDGCARSDWSSGPSRTSGLEWHGLQFP